MNTNGKRHCLRLKYINNSYSGDVQRWNTLNRLNIKYVLQGWRGAEVMERQRRQSEVE